MTLTAIVGNASAVSRQVFERVQPVEVVDRNQGHGIRLGQPKVDGDAAPPLRIRLSRTPEGDAAANWTKVELERLAPHVGLRVARVMDAFALEVVGPEHAVAAAYR